MRLGVTFVFLCVLLHGQNAVVVSGGKWKLDDGRELGTIVKEVPAGTQVNGTNAYPLMLACGGDWVVHQCASPTCKLKACGTSGGSRTVKPWEWSKSTPDGFLQGLLKREPATAMTAGARDALDVSDALVLLDGGTAHFAPALRRVLEGSYCMQLEGLPKGRSAPRSFVLDWKRDPQGAITLAGLASGLYALEAARMVAGSTCKIDLPSPSPSWVLIGTQSQFESWKKEWDRFSPNVAQVEAESDPEIATTIRHALMAALADSIQ